MNANDEKGTIISTCATVIRILILLGLLYVVFLTDFLDMINPVFYAFPTKCLTLIETVDGNVVNNDTKQFGVELELHLKELIIRYPVRLMKVFILVMYVYHYDKAGSRYLLIHERPEYGVWKLMVAKMHIIVSLFGFVAGYRVIITGTKYVYNILCFDLCAMDFQDPVEEEMLYCIGHSYHMCMGYVFLSQGSLCFYILSKVFLADHMSYVVRIRNECNLERVYTWKMKKVEEKNGIPQKC